MISVRPIVKGLIRRSSVRESLRLLDARHVAARRRLAKAIALEHWDEAFDLIGDLERKQAALPSEQCAELLVDLTAGEPSAELLGAVFNAKRDVLGTSFLLVLMALTAIEHQRHSDVYHVIVEELRELYAGVEQGRPLLQPLARVSFLLSLALELMKDGKRRVLTELDPADVIVLWSGLLKRHLKELPSHSGAKRERDRVLRALLQVVTVEANIEESSDFIADMEFLFELSRSTGDATLQQRVLKLSRSAFHRPRYDETVLARKLITTTNSAAQASSLGQDRESRSLGFEELLATMKSQDELGESNAARSMIDRLEELATTPAQRLKLGYTLSRMRSRSLTIRGALLIEELASSGEMNDPALRSELVNAKFKLAKDDDLKKLVLDEQTLSEMPPARAAFLCRIQRNRQAGVKHLQRRMKAASRSLASGRSAADFDAFSQCAKEIRSLKFLEEANAHLRVGIPPGPPKSLLVLLVKDERDLNHMPILAFRELKARGHGVVSLLPGIIDAAPTGLPELDEIAGALGQRMRSSRWHREPVDWINDWQVDLPAGKAICKGVNFFQGLEERLCCKYRRYLIDYSDNTIRTQALQILQQMDTVIGCIDRLKEKAVRTGVPIRLFVVTHHTGATYAARRYINEVSSEGDIELFQSCSAYENYFKNFKAEIASTLAVRSMTRYSALSRSAVPPKDDFEQWYQTEWPKLADRSEAGAAVRINRVRSDKGSAEANPLRNRLRKERSAGRRIVCLFGKVLFDQGVPMQGGPAHDGMKDWFDHTLSIVSRNPDTLLLVKPHPHELRDEIALYPTEVLQDWMPNPTPDNVVFLPHDMFNLHELAELIDLGLVWNGSASIELGVLGIPCVVCAFYGVLDYPVGHVTPRDRGHYEELLSDPLSIRAAPHVADKSRAYLDYVRTPEMSTPYRYTRRSLTNRPVRLAWIQSDVEDYYREGDPNVSFIAGRIEGGNA